MQCAYIGHITKYELNIYILSTTIIKMSSSLNGFGNFIFILPFDILTAKESLTRKKIFFISNELSITSKYKEDKINQFILIITTS